MTDPIAHLLILATYSKTKLNKKKKETHLPCAMHGRVTHDTKVDTVQLQNQPPNGGVVKATAFPRLPGSTFLVRSYHCLEHLLEFLPHGLDEPRKIVGFVQPLS